MINNGFSNRIKKKYIQLSISFYILLNRKKGTICNFFLAKSKYNYNIKLFNKKIKTCYFIFLNTTYIANTFFVITKLFNLNFKYVSLDIDSIDSAAYGLCRYIQLIYPL